MIIYKRVTMQDLFLAKQSRSYFAKWFLMALTSKKKMLGREARAKTIYFKSQRFPKFLLMSLQVLGDIA
jgi:hypothetical protein